MLLSRPGEIGVSKRVFDNSYYDAVAIVMTIRFARIEFGQTT